jgi:hypothetical protein
MLAYEFYWFDPVNGYEHIGTLPERRNQPERITQESIINWARTVLGKHVDPNDIFFVEITIDENMSRSFRPDQIYKPLAEIEG